ncbi:uncharacterized protein N0V89_010751 [Didymosphaeria variabile]|uniref:EthD domain-containing protein n=1 Tax=Didymosphaeria variabile TaxID=1932322 RepID=A0A9W9C6H3_9PLEO|nr:uncharacterized protein N0V89_010751 [Didymosphaeria variabile]KAJ4346819.1 hypothetical protein N0V89_010751 [Didymosphaeria variabile]
MAPQKETLIKFTSRRYKSEGVSDEEFHAFATRDHAPKAAPIQARHGFLGVRQSFKPAALRALLTEGPFGTARPQHWTVDDHDFEVVFYVRSMEQLGALLADPDFQKLMGDEADMCDPGRAELSIGWEEMFVEDGKVVNVEDGTSAYQPWADSVEKLTGKKPGQ